MSLLLPLLLRRWWGCSRLSAPAGAAAAAPRLDSGFGNGGVARVPFRVRSGLGPLRPVRQPDGKVLVAAAIPVDPLEPGPAEVAARALHAQWPSRTRRLVAEAGCGSAPRWNFLPRSPSILQPDGRDRLAGPGGDRATGFYPVKLAYPGRAIMLWTGRAIAALRQQRVRRMGPTADTTPRRRPPVRTAPSQADGRLLVALSVSGVRRVSNYPLRALTNVSFSRGRISCASTRTARWTSRSYPGLGRAAGGPPNFGDLGGAA